MRNLALSVTVLSLILCTPHLGTAADVDSDTELQEALPAESMENEAAEPPSDDYEALQEESMAEEADAPPPLAYNSPPDMVVVPSGSAAVYMLPDTPGIYFYGGSWYRYYGGNWYGASAYNGSWGYISASSVPPFVMDLPPEYVTYLPHNYARIRYNDFRRNWQSWDRDRHWQKQAWYKHEMRSEVRGERFDRIRQEQARMRAGEHREPGRYRNGKMALAPLSGADHLRTNDRRQLESVRRGPEGDRMRGIDAKKGRVAETDRVKKNEMFKAPGSARPKPKEEKASKQQIFEHERRGF